MSGGAKDDVRVVLYTTLACGWCGRAKALLDARGVDFREERLDRSAESRERLAAVAPDARTFPQIVVDGRPIGGYAELEALDRAGRLTELAR